MWTFVRHDIWLPTQLHSSNYPLRYLSISWIVLGHVLWEYCNTSSFGAFTSSARATGDGTDNVAATVAGATSTISTYIYLQYLRR